MRSLGVIASPRTDRIDHLDLMRGVAALGILVMNAVSFSIGEPGYFRLNAAGYSSLADKGIGVLGEVFVDQKMMGLFSLLFGASIVLFVERVGSRRRHPIWLSLWRNLLLLAIGLLHSLFWEGDVLTTYAICAPILLVARRWKPFALYCTAGALFALSIVAALLAQSDINDRGPQALGWYWYTADGKPADSLLAFFVVDGFARALALMLIGVALYRSGLLSGSASRGTYRRLAVGGFVVGLPFAVAGMTWQLLDNFSYRIALSSAALNNVATVPMTLGLVGLIMTWSTKPSTGLTTALLSRLRSVGQMALTSYLTQTAIGLIVLRGLFERGDVGRATLVVFIVLVWIAQLLWSRAWLDRFSNGPIEWLWRVATYLQWQPFMRRS
jgi:uncharacterized protein